MAAPRERRPAPIVKVVTDQVSWRSSAWDELWRRLLAQVSQATHSENDENDR